MLHKLQEISANFRISSGIEQEKKVCERMQNLFLSAGQHIHLDNTTRDHGG